MNNLRSFKEDDKFQQLKGQNAEIILNLARKLKEEGYILNGNWREDTYSGGNNLCLELIQEIGGRKNLVTLRLMKTI